jgi:copper homeostasis protein
MSIVNTLGDDRRATALLEVVVTHPRDVPGADEGGADRLFVVTDMEAGGLSPEPATVSTVCKETEVPVRVMLRLNDGLSTTGGEISRLVGLGEDFLSVGAEGLSFGFLTSDLEIDVDVCSYLADRLPQVPWTFHRAVDSALSTDRAWRQLAGLPGIDAVLSAGSVRGLEAGCDELVDRASADPQVARLLVAGGGLRPEHVPWLARAGVRRFHVGSTVRPGGSWTRSSVDAAHVRSWRMLLDDAAEHAEAARRAAGGAGA